MACSGCSKRLKAAQKRLAEKAASLEQSQTLLFCPACKVQHTEQQYRQCPLRLQLEKQKAREARYKQHIEQQKQLSQVQTRRGRELPPPQFSSPTNVFSTQTKKKW